MNVLDFKTKKANKQKITMVTCYDFAFAQILDATPVDCILVGDSLAMVMHGYPSTVHATIEMMALHTKSVSSGAPNKFIVGDMPFLSFRKGVSFALDCVDKLMKSGAHAVKLENVKGHEDVVKAIVESGVPVMGHLGLTPQSVNQLGGFKVQGKLQSEGKLILEDALKLQELGCFSLVLECVPLELSKIITTELQIPTIGIGAGNVTDGQVLVLQDLLGFNQNFKPKFLKHFSNFNSLTSEAIGAFCRQTESGEYPSEKESYL